MRFFIFLVFLFLKVQSQSLYLERFERHAEKLAGPQVRRFHWLNRTALTLVFEEEAAIAGTTPQDRVNKCADCLYAYGEFRDELISIGDEGADNLGYIVKEYNNNLVWLYKAQGAAAKDSKEESGEIIKNSDEEDEDEYAKENGRELTLEEKLQRREERFMQYCSEYLPETVDFIKSKINQMKQSNASEGVISFVKSTFEKILKANGVDNGNKRSDSEMHYEYTYVQMTYDSILTEHQKLTDDEKALVNKFFCTNIMNKKILSIDGTALDLYQKLPEGILKKSLNFTEIIVDMELSSQFKGLVWGMTLEGHLKNHAYIANVSVREHFNVCMDNIVGYRNMSEEHRNISEENRSSVIRVLNSTNRQFDDLEPYLPVTFEFAAPKLAAIKQWTLANNTIDIVESMLFHIVEEHVVKRNYDMNWILDDMIEQKGWKLPNDQEQIVSRYFCFSYINLIECIRSGKWGV